MTFLGIDATGLGNPLDGMCASRKQQPPAGSASGSGTGWRRKVRFSR